MTAAEDPQGTLLMTVVVAAAAEALVSPPRRLYTKRLVGSMHQAYSSGF